MNPSLPVERSPAFSSRCGILWLLLLKELRETLRDRRTIVTLLAMPLLLYPLLGIGFRFIALQQSQDEAPAYSVAFATPDEAHWLMASLEQGQRALTHSLAAENSGRTTKSGLSEIPQLPKLDVLVPDGSAPFDLHSTIQEGSAELGVAVSIVQQGAKPVRRVELICLQGSHPSEEAARIVAECLQAQSLSVVSSWATAHDPEFRWPIQTVTKRLNSQETTSPLLSILPLVLLLMTVTGGVYPSIDLTAGERERETLETLMALPFSSVQILSAKFLAVLVVTLLTGAMNLVAMLVTIQAMSLDRTLFGGSGLSLLLAIKLCAVLIVFGVFFSAVLLAVTSAARSFKEAQAYLIPLMLLCLTPSLVILLPGWRLQGVVAVAPLVNMLLLARDMFEGTVTATPSLMAIVSTLLYSAVALSIAATQFGRGAVLAGSAGTLTDLFRRPNAPQADAPQSVVWFSLAALFPFHFYASHYLGQLSELTMVTRLVLSAVMTVLLFAAWPTFLTAWFRISRGSTWNIPWMAWLGAILLGIGLWPWIFEAIMVTRGWGWTVLDKDRLEMAQKLAESWGTVPVWILVFTLGITPGVCEEIYFRGFLLRGVLPVLGKTGTILVTGLIFGLFHVILSGGLAPERLLPSTLLGWILGWVAIRTGSVWPGVMLHSLNNATLLMLVSWQKELTRAYFGQLEQSHLPASWLGGAACLIGLGAWSVWQSTRRTSA